MAMVVTGPWQLSDIYDHKVSYGVQVMPSFGGSHETISGPDVYMVFNHSDERRAAAVTFMSWLHEPAQDLQWDIGSGNLPLSAKTAALPGFKAVHGKYPGVDAVRQEPRSTRTTSARRVPQYTQISVAVGKAIATSLLGRGSPKDTLAPGGQDRRQSPGLSRGGGRTRAPAPAGVAKGPAREPDRLGVRAPCLGVRARARVLPGDLVVPALDQGQ